MFSDWIRASSRQREPPVGPLSRYKMRLKRRSHRRKIRQLFSNIYRYGIDISRLYIERRLMYRSSHFANNQETPVISPSRRSRQKVYISHMRDKV
jgi:hypothetical protein